MENKERVLEYLRQNFDRYVSPTEVGEEVGGGNRHSAWGSPLCKKLVAEGLATRNEKGWYNATDK